MKAPFHLPTIGQRRCFHLLTLAQMAWLEHTGTRVTHTSAKAQAIALLDLSPQEGANGISIYELIAALRAEALKSRGIHDAEAPRRAIPPTAPDDAATV